ncbi:MAG: hypothetical protein K2Y37_10720 [Pirellulales bacterium]|nr:hypothetical protein [Pirellulales bacterium]
MPLAMTDLGLGIVTACFAVCLALIVNAIFPRRALSRAVHTHGRIASMVFAAVEFLALWLWLSLALPVLYAILARADSYHGFFDYAWLIAAAIAASIAALGLRRYQRGTATPGYRRFHGWVPLCLLALFCTIRTYDFLLGIDGRTAAAAAQNIVAHFALEEPVRLVELTPAEAASDVVLGTKTFWIMGANEPRGRLTVKPYYGFWWTYAGVVSLRPSYDELTLAKAVLGAPWERNRAIELLRGVVTNYPNTAAASEARELLQSLTPLANES